jgi:hypothetical protein
MGDGISDAIRDQRLEWMELLAEVPDDLLNAEYYERQRIAIRQQIIQKEKELLELKEQMKQIK